MNYSKKKFYINFNLIVFLQYIIRIRKVIN